jgi:hypothetical protein
MQRPRHTSLLVVLLVVSVTFVRAQTAADPSGHWEGTIKAPDKDVPIEIDLAKNSNGELAATFSNPGEHLSGLPLANVVADGRSLRFVLKAGSGGGPFDGMLADDGRSITGTFTVATGQGNFALPFTLTRTGDARIEAPPKNAAVGKDLEGTWNGTIDVDGKQMRVLLKMLNHPDGTATGIVANLDQPEVEIPLTTITQNASQVSLEVKVIGGAYVGALNAAGTELTGTWTQGGFTAPLTFRKR